MVTLYIKYIGRKVRTPLVTLEKDTRIKEAVNGGRSAPSPEDAE